MITPDDVEFHEPTDPADPAWSETNFFGFYNAELHTNIGLYALFRPTLGVVNSTVAINSGDALQPWRADFFDHQVHLPIPAEARLGDFRLGNGLAITCLQPNQRWHLAFDDGDGTVVDVEYTALMRGFDINDPDEDPITAALRASDGFSWGEAYKGHFDQTGRYRGQVEVRGRQIPIDCVSTMDHSWGQRRERGGPNMSWLHAHFGDDFAVHAIWSFDHTGQTEELTLNHGYVLSDGVVTGLVSGSGRTSRDADLYARTTDLSLVDAAGRQLELHGTGLTRFPWLAWPNMVGFNVLARWECDGRTGYGELQDFVDVTRLTGLSVAARHDRVRADA